MGEGTIETPSSDRWADQAARTLRLVHLVSTILLVGAVLAVVLGMITATTQLATQWSDLGMATSGMSSMRIGQFASTVMSSLLPSGVMLAAGGYLRLQALRFETDLLVEDDLVEVAVDAG
ncbi:hypothetical protein [Dermatobacter hominis]|uniref:hypothetical protein n=1 Tax=Dermatobacter hominis TaxID=2884263 RepID=UPI001D1122C9|nr:hypothetical protein [Dermatobacter hominis]UDY35883.1 hypothetical protein LH044_21515 [Dermatobacter hominis]